MNAIGSQFVLSNGAREALKWVALVLMTGDHVDAVFFGRSFGLLSEFGRIAMPLFAVVLAYNLCGRSEGQGIAAIRRLALIGALAQPFHAWAFGFALPVNILFTYALGIAVYYTWRRSRWAALVLLVIGGPWVDFQWSGVLLMAALLGYFSDRDVRWLWAVGAAMVGLCLYNGNTWALLAAPIVLVARHVDVQLPRWRWLFPAYYAGHLALLAGLRFVI